MTPSRPSGGPVPRVFNPLQLTRLVSLPAEVERLGRFLPTWIIILVACVVTLGCNPDPYPGEEGAVLHISQRQLPKSLDPPAIEDEGSGKAAAPVYEGLLMYHPYARPISLDPRACRVDARGQ